MSDEPKRGSAPRVVRRRTEIAALSFVVPVAPLAWARPRFHNGRGYTPTEVDEHRDAIRWKALEARANWERANVEQWPRLKDHEYALLVRAFRQTRRGDTDNFAKQVCDALDGTLFADDRQIWRLECERFDVADEDWSGAPRYEIAIRAFAVVELKISTKNKAQNE